MAFTFSGIAGVSESQIENVQILFDTDGTGIITTTKAPEPGTMLIAFGLVANLCCLRGQRFSDA